MKIGISLPVHERLDIILNQIVNIKSFIDNPVICLHVSSSSSIDYEQLKLISQLTGAVLNNTRLQTKHGCGLMGVHCSNFRILKNYGIDYMLLMSSNELLIKRGLENYISNFDLGVQIAQRYTCPDWHIFKKDIGSIPNVRKFIQELEMEDYCGGQAEGQFFKRDLFEVLAERYERIFGLDLQEFDTEEVIPSTFFSSKKYLSLKYSQPITLQNYTIDIVIEKKLIERIKAGKGVILGNRLSGTLFSPHLGSGSISSIHSVKRVERNWNETRQFITSL